MEWITCIQIVVFRLCIYKLGTTYAHRISELCANEVLKLLCLSAVELSDPNRGISVLMYSTIQYFSI